MEHIILHWLKEMSRILAIDFGLKRIGLAISDELKLIAVPYKAIPNDENALSEIIKIIDVEDVNEIIIGLPLNLDGREGDIAGKVRQFGGELKKHVKNITIKFFDERFTSKMAEKKFIEKKKKIPLGDKNKKEIDKLAAAYLLQNYLDSRYLENEST